MGKKKKDRVVCKHGNICNPTKAQLFFTECNMAAFNGDDDAEVIWQDIASLTICGTEYSDVHHVVTGNIRVTFEESNDTNAVADFLFRIVDEEGRVICQRRIRYTESEPDADIEVIFPWAFQCFQHLTECGDQVLTLQADLLDERLAEPNNQVFLENVDWAATVFFKDACGKDDCHDDDDDHDGRDKKKVKKFKSKVYY